MVEDDCGTFDINFRTKSARETDTGVTSTWLRVESCIVLWFKQVDGKEGVYEQLPAALADRIEAAQQVRPRLPPLPVTRCSGPSPATMTQRASFNGMARRTWTLRAPCSWTAPSTRCAGCTCDPSPR